MKHWETLPTWWNRQDPCPLIGLQGGNHAGTSQAALRVLLALAVSDRDKATYDVWSTLDELEELTGMSRNLVLRGIKRASDAGLIAYEAGGPRQKSHFHLTHPELAADTAGGWAKIPVEQVRKRMREIPMRGQAPLVSLKIYMLLLANRPNDNAVVRLSHERIQYKTGSQTRTIRSALSLLANVGLIHIIKESDDRGSASAHSATPYQILGALDVRGSWKA